jgi:DNA-binding NtrC family response regulator
MSEKILFVDDEPAILDGYRRLLRGDYEIDTAAGGKLALEIMAKQSYAVVIADMRMPEMDGAQLLSRIAGQYPGTMRIMLTGNSDMQTAVRAVNDGAVFRFLTKPCEKEILRTTIQAALAQYRLSGLQQENLGTTATHKPLKKKTNDPALVEIEDKVRKILAVKSVSIRTPSVVGAIYVGRTIWNGPNYIVQSVAGTVAIAHPKNLLDQIPEIGDNVKIEYTAGTASVTNIGG